MTFDARGQDSSTFQHQPVEEQIDILCDEFEAAWRSGRTVRAEEFIAGKAGPGVGQPFQADTATLLRELLALEIDYRRRRGETVERVELLKRFPDDAALVEHVFPPAVPLEAPEPALETLSQYRLLSKIGKGGMGTVYKAMHTRLEKIVAIKVLAADHTQNGQALARFEREMKAVGRLQHPNIVGAHDAGEVDGVHFLVMEYVDGIDLASLLKLHGPLSASDACELGRQAAVGLQEASEHGMVHRDVKPSNLMLTVQRRKGKPSGVVKLLDLGLAALTDPAARSHVLTQTGQLMGTVDYMSPEQIQDVRNVDIRSDLYSLGATLYKLLTSNAPFANDENSSLQKRLRAVIKTPAAPIASLRPDLPPEVAALIDRLLAKNPDDRPATPDEVVEVLARFADSVSPELLSMADGSSRTAIGVSGSTRSTQSLDAAAVTVKRSQSNSPPIEEAAIEPPPATPTPSRDRKRRRWAVIALATLAFVVMVAIYLSRS